MLVYVITILDYYKISKHERIFMKTPTIILIAYLILMNLAGFLSMGIDKRRAIKHKWRIPEKTLFLFALLGGSVGSNCGMEFFRHKTKHWYFVVFMPLIL